jgi:hypothetical protein
VLEALTCIEGGEGKRMGSHNVVSEVSLAKPGGMVPLMAFCSMPLPKARRRNSEVWAVGGGDAGGADVHSGQRGQWLGAHNSVSEGRLAKPGGMVPLMALKARTLVSPKVPLREERMGGCGRWVAAVKRAQRCTEGGEGRGVHEL